MKPIYQSALAVISLTTMLCVAAPAQGPSLAELARQERARKQAEPKAGKVFTNEDIPTPTISPAAESGAPAEAAPKPTETAPAVGAEPEEPAEKTQAELEKEYRAKFAQLRSNLELEERRLDVLQREFNLAQQQFYTDPNVALREQYSREELNKRQEEIQKQQETVEKAKQAISDLEEELRRKGLPPGWARE